MKDQAAHTPVGCCESQKKGHFLSVHQCLNFSKLTHVSAAGESRAFTVRLSAGCAIALVGFAFYSYSKVLQQQAKRMAATTPVSNARVDFDEEAASEKVPLLK